MKHFYSQIKNFLNIALFLGIFLQSYLANSQTTLGVGDLIFTGYDATATPSPTAADSYSFVLLTNISAGTVISFSDRGYNGAGWQATGGTEGSVTWTSGTAIAMGTEILIKGLAASTYNPSTSTLTANGTVSVSEGTFLYGLSLSNVGDQVIAFQGGSGSVSGSGVTLLSGITYFMCNASTSTATWDTVASGCTIGPNSSVMPPGLTGGTNAFYTGTLAGNTLSQSSKYNGTGAPFTNAAGIRAAVMNQANWTLSTTAQTMPSGAPFLGVAPTITANPPNRTLCVGGSTTFPITASDATAYQWQVNTGSGFTNLTNVAPYSNVTTATLTVTTVTAAMSGYLYRCVASGAGSVTSNQATLTVPDMIISTSAQTSVSCKGGSNGSATLTVTGGIAPYTYSWSPSGGTAATASGLGAGTYTVTVTDNILCSKTHTVTIAEPAAILNGTPGVTNVSCFGGSNGIASIAPSGGTPGYTYLWSNGATTATATGLLAGSYSVTITDANSCTRTINSIIVGQPAAILNGIPTSTAVSCFGGGNGSATITASGGTPGYTYLWSNGATTATATNLQAGTYSVTITDANSCTRTINNIIVGQPAAPLNGSASTTAVSCFGGSNGTATVVPSGGTSGYTYLWSNGATTASATGLAAGTYSVTITDANSCTRPINNIIVGQPAFINPTPSQINVSCFGGTNGAATVTPTGGTGAYTYVWNTGATTNFINNLLPGTYSVTITDANSCQITQSFTITQPLLLAASQGTVNNVSCNGGSNGSATVLVTGGTPAYSYSWSPSGGVGATASGLTPGTYTVTVTDANACQTTQAFTISQPAPFNVTTSQTDLICNGAATGSASVVVTGATAPYTYSWSPSGGTAATATGLTAGNYTVTIIDNNNCQTTRNFTLTQPSALVATAGTVTNVNCRGEATGAATVNVTGGTGTYTYSWAPSGGTAATATDLLAGNYTVTITDANACQTTRNFTITQPAAILSATTASTGVSCFGGSNGSASVTVSGGTPGYTYAWAPLGGTASAISGRPAGNYTCTITDSKGCTLIKNITISTPAAFSGTIAKTDVSCNGGSNGSATVTATGATAPYTYTWSPSGGNAPTASGLTAGSYTVTVQDANTCTYTVNVTINQPASLFVSPSQTNVLCNGGATGTATVVATGGTPGYTYLWSPAGGTAATATGLAAGSYTCLVTDNNGCTFTQGFNITEPAILVASTSKIDATCVTGGQAAVNPSGGTLPYTYSWSNGATTQIVTGLAAGNYSALITDGNGCTITKNFTINTTNTLVAVKSQVNVLCNGSATGSATVVPSGAPGPFTYVWAPTGGNTDTASNLTAGNYTVTITSSNGCSTVIPFAITQPAPLAVTPSQTNIACNSGTNGSATVNVTGGTGVYTYSWAPSGGTAATASGLSAGTYTVTITDTNLCQITQSFTLTEPTALAASTAVTNVSCNGGTNGSASINVTGGTGAYTYSWSPTGGSAATASGLAAGTYTVTATDANSCTIVQAITITEPTALSATFTQTNVTCAGGNDGQATVAVTGGTGVYNYVWSPAGGTAATATGLTAGNYSVTITDDNGCSFTQPITILTSPDVTAPVPDVTNLPDITNYCAILSAEIAIPTATDICAGIVNATTTSPLNYTTEGTYVIVWNYDDGNGNISSQNQTLHVLASPLDLVTFTDTAVSYTGNTQALQVANLPAGATVAYSITPAGSTTNGAINVGTYTVTAVVSPSASSANCSPITLTAELTINKAAQQITFAPIPAKILGAVSSFNLEATSNSGLAIRYSFTYTSALPPASVTAAGLVNLLRSGDLLIVAHQDGDSNYLPATDVSQVLVIKNNDVSVTKITIGTKVYPNPAKEIKYVMACGESNVNVSILNETSAIITPSANFTITPPKAGIYTQNVSVTSQDGSATANYTIVVEKPFGFYDIVHQKFNNVLIVNNNPQTNGGYEFVSYQWFKNGQVVGTGQYYSAGEAVSNTLDASADYSVKMTTKDGKVLSTCTTKITTQKTLSAKLYPNPIQTGKVITVETDFPSEELENMQISLYSVSGQLVKTLKSSSVKTEIQLPDADGTMYVVVIETPNIKKTLKVIVNK
jgi:hypothetical protein